MNLLNFFTTIIEKTAEFKMYSAYRSTQSALSVFYVAKAKLEKANKHLEETQKDVTSQLNRLNTMSASLSSQAERNTKYIENINKILD